MAKKYDLYTKITGGQRIDLFGAQLHELPDIWGELIAAGFETGHAYGKSLRTVKSCVGSTGAATACRTASAWRCARRTARARVRRTRSSSPYRAVPANAPRRRASDIGVIATDKGWNLYIRGNGGMRPRHAELFATDLDDETLIRIIDRVLMFYVRTADKLQRTSVWRESWKAARLLEGRHPRRQPEPRRRAGEPDAARGRQLPVRMGQRHLRSEKLKRFRTFVNDGRADPTSTSS